MGVSNKATASASTACKPVTGLFASYSHQHTSDFSCLALEVVFFCCKVNIVRCTEMQEPHCMWNKQLIKDWNSNECIKVECTWVID